MSELPTDVYVTHLTLMTNGAPFSNELNPSHGVEFRRSSGRTGRGFLYVDRRGGDTEGRTASSGASGIPDSWSLRCLQYCRAIRN